jgi:hypothetical protein
MMSRRTIGAFCCSLNLRCLYATEEHIFDILVGYWHAKKMAFVAADSPAAPANGQTVRVFKWAELPDHSDITLRSQVHLERKP